MIKANHLHLLFMLFFATSIAKAQGCSDAGFCTMGAMKPDQAYSKKINFKLRSIELSEYRGKTTLTPVVWVTNLDATIGINNKTAFQVKLPYQYVTGNFGKTKGIGDISLSLTRAILNTEKFTINATVGAKIPTNKSDLKKENNEFGSEGKDFPMYYQISLGSYDIIAGVSLISSKWLFAFGYQQALTANNNQFKWGDWPKYPTPEQEDKGEINAYVKKYDRATKLKRGTDIMFRVERNWRFSNYNFSFGALPIIRVKNDQIQGLVNGEPNGEYKSLSGTTGMALSLLASAGYHFNVNSSVKFIYGYKITDRDVNPDGLTRHSVQTIAYVYRF